MIAPDLFEREEPFDTDPVSVDSIETSRLLSVGREFVLWSMDAEDARLDTVFHSVLVPAGTP